MPDWSGHEMSRMAVAVLSAEPGEEDGGIGGRRKQTTAPVAGSQFDPVQVAASGGRYDPENVLEGGLEPPQVTPQDP